MAVANMRKVSLHDKKSFYKKANGDTSRKTNSTAKETYEKYIMLADQSVTKGDCIDAEIFYQHAEHYLRLMNGSNPGNDDSAYDKCGIVDGSRG